jgi:hypothetical protein
MRDTGYIGVYPVSRIPHLLGRNGPNDDQRRRMLRKAAESGGHHPMIGLTDDKEDYHQEIGRCHVDAGYRSIVPQCGLGQE